MGELLETILNSSARPVMAEDVGPWLRLRRSTGRLGRMCAWTRPRFGRGARIGCAQAKLYGWLGHVAELYERSHATKSKRHVTKSHATKNGSMQLKAMRLKMESCN